VRHDGNAGASTCGGEQGVRAVRDEHEPRRREHRLKPRRVLQWRERWQIDEQIETARRPVDAQAFACDVRARRVETGVDARELDR